MSDGHDRTSTWATARRGVSLGERTVLGWVWLIALVHRSGDFTGAAEWGDSREHEALRDRNPA
ncbi:MAG: hypothetical protein AAFU71_10485 [Cyanobacteria bacterium J06632_22]